MNYDRRIIKMRNIITVNSEGGYDPKVAAKKIAKNMGVMFGIPAVLFLIDNAAELIPPDMWPVLLPILSAISYGVKNYLENK